MKNAYFLSWTFNDQNNLQRSLMKDERKAAKMKFAIMGTFDASKCDLSLEIRRQEMISREAR